jgi:hypothetical protein
MASEGREDAHDYKIIILEDSGKEMVLQAESVADKKIWLEAIKMHISYANGQYDTA